MKRSHRNAFSRTVLGIYNAINNAMNLITTQPQALITASAQQDQSLAIVPYQPQPSSEKHSFSNLPFEVISYILQQRPIFDSFRARAVNKTFLRAWQHAAQAQLFTLNPAIQHLHMDDGVKILQDKQQKEVDYLTAKEEVILNNNRDNPKLKKAFAKLADLKGNQSLIAYHAREVAINTINEVNIRNQIYQSDRELDCSRYYLTRIPESVLKDEELKPFWTQLTKLNISYNQISVLPDAIGQLTGLREFNASYNQLTALPTTIEQLTGLEKLYVRKNALTALPNTIGKLGALTLLNANDNQIAFLPESIGQLSALERFYIHNNKLAVLPNSIIECTELQSLTVTENYLRDLPTGLNEGILRHGFLGKVNKIGCLASQKAKPIEDNQAESEERPAKRQRLN
ncbi:MAG: hypothetical protein JSS07_00665 [Proteobacteria bacterium]|nr:hypothetical protein [Pseudomonadota bacterium]